MDFDDDGKLDVLTGSNCCAKDWCHWYRINDDGKLSKRFDIHFTVDPQYKQVEKHESRPHFFDWNRDGIKDLVVVTTTWQMMSDGDKEPEYRSAYRIFVSKDSVSLPSKIKSANDGKPKQAIKHNSLLPPGIDLEVELRAVTDEEFEKVVATQLSPSSDDRVIEQHYEFADFDNDGNIDILFSEVKNQKTPNRYVISNSIYWMRNLSKSGEPKFAKPEKIVEFPSKWRANSFSVTDLDGDDDLDVVASVYERLKGNHVDAQLWFLKRK